MNKNFHNLLKIITINIHIIISLFFNQYKLLLVHSIIIYCVNIGLVNSIWKLRYLVAKIQWMKENVERCWLHHIVPVFSKFQAPPNLHRSVEKASESDYPYI